MKGPAARLLLLLLAGLASSLIGLPAAHADSPDSVSFSTQSPRIRSPLAPGTDNDLKLMVSVSLSTATSSAVRLVGYADGTGDPIALGGDTPYTRERGGDLNVTVSYRPPATGMRWLAVQAVLGPPDAPLASSSMVPFVVMAPLLGKHSTVYYSASVGRDLATSYASAFDAIWQTVGDTFNSYNDQSVRIMLAGDADTFAQARMSAGVSAAFADATKSAVRATNLNNTIVVNFGVSGPPLDTINLGHEYAENRFRAIQPGNEAAGWFWDGMADEIGIHAAANLPGTNCDIQSKEMSRWRTSLFALRDGNYLPLSSISTQAQWQTNITTPAEETWQYAEGYTAVDYWQRRFGFDSLVNFVEAPKQQPADFAGALQQLLGESMDQFEGDYLAAMRAALDQAPAVVPVTVQLNAGGITPQTYIGFTSDFGPGQGQLYRTQPGLAPGDYAFTFNADGTVTSADGKTTLTAAPWSFSANRQGERYTGIYHPAYQGQAGADGMEALSLLDIYGRAGLAGSYFGALNTQKAERRQGDCLAPWPDGNQITASIP